MRVALLQHLYSTYGIRSQPGLRGNLIPVDDTVYEPVKTSSTTQGLNLKAQTLGLVRRRELAQVHGVR